MASEYLPDKLWELIERLLMFASGGLLCQMHNRERILPGEIPAIGNLADAQNANRKVWIGWATAAFVFATILVGSAFRYLRG